MKTITIFCVAALMFLLLGAVSGAQEGTMKLTTSAFTPGGNIPLKYGCGPERNWRKPSIPLKWEGAPAGTKSFVMLMDDPHPVAKYWVHWLVVDLPAGTPELPEGASGKAIPAGAREGKNSYGETAYGGPCPPSGSHTYRFQLFAMPTEKTVLTAEGKRGDVLTEELKAKALAVAQFEGNYP